MTINTVAVTGHVAGTPEIREEGDGSRAAEFDLVLTEHRKINGEWATVEEAIPVTVWGKQGEACAEYLEDGSPVAVQGRLKRDAQGELGVVAQSVHFLAPKREPVAVPVENQVAELRAEMEEWGAGGRLTDGEGAS